MNKRIFRIAGALAAFAAAGCCGYAVARPGGLPPEAANAAMAALLAQADKPETKRGAVPDGAPSAPSAAPSASAALPSAPFETPAAPVASPSASSALPAAPSKAPATPSASPTVPAAVPSTPSAPAAAPGNLDHTAPPASTPQLDLNAATLEQLLELPGIGESRAKAIVELRGRLGKFDKVEQLLEAKGIGDKVLEKLKPFVRVGGP
jgi:competence protein ComEA